MTDNDKIADDKLVIGGHEFDSRFILGSGKYSMTLIEAAIKDAGAQIVTLAVRRAHTKEQENILSYIPEKSPVPAQNTSSAHIRRIIVGSIPKYSARPPHTPNIFLSVCDL